jgi:predicted membrane chloride channel (bestrophin family)
MQPTLLTVIGTVLGFVISYRTTSSFERYNEGRRLWSQIMLASRTYARTVWFHVPDTKPGDPTDLDENRARVLIEKKTAINLLEAFAIAVKHYLRGEDGIFYQDLYHLVKFLPPYALPHGMPSVLDVNDPLISPSLRPKHSIDANPSSPPSSPKGERFSNDPSMLSKRPRLSSSEPHIPLPVTSPSKKTTFLQSPPPHRDPSQARRSIGEKSCSSLGVGDGFLLPARMPPKYHIFDLFPFSLLVRLLTKKGKQVKGRKAARLRAKLKRGTVSHNLPLEISLYLSSYIGAMQSAKVIDVPTTNNLLASLNQLVDALTGLERILTTPIPFSYSIHLWVVTIIYCLALPLQIWSTLKWLTIPATVVLAFIFFGFLVAGEEIENPFGYDKNDLNMDHFTHNIIRNELRALTAFPAPSPTVWAFSSENDLCFASNNHLDSERVSPEDWVKRGMPEMRAALAF